MHPTEMHQIPAKIRKQKKLSILMPFLNEEKVIVENTREVIRILQELDFNFEVVLIDDGSRDNSYELLLKNFKKDPSIKIVRNFKNFGKGWALKTGYEFSTGDYVLFLDSDLELSPYHIPNFFNIMLENQADAVIGSKLHKDSILEYPLKRRIISFIYYSFIKIFFGLPIMDSQTGIKLFKRDALEMSLPKVLVKKFAFDIELLIILHQHHKKVCSAPIELKFSRGVFSRNIKLNMLFHTFLDTLAVFYRDRILGFYDRPLGKNIPLFYTIILFSEKNNAYELECLRRFLSINYEHYQVILAGKSAPGLKDPKLTFVKCDEGHYARRLEIILQKNIIKGDYLVFSKMDAFPDERYLFSTGRILSLEDVGAAGGYVNMRNHPAKFEAIAFSVLSSVFLNLNLVYRFKPVNYKEVGELQLNGLFIKKACIKDIHFDHVRGLKLEYILSKQVKKHHLKVVYSPDLMLYQVFPKNPVEMVRYIKKEALFRVSQFRSPVYKSFESFYDKKFSLSVALLATMAASLTFFIIRQNPVFLMPLGVYYTFLLISRLIVSGLKNGILGFIWLSFAQLLYGFYFFFGLFKKD
jgi:glycosyltransferase involved in cell wall biosynthesis